MEILKSKMPPKRKGFFIVLEGPDRSGKSTQAALLIKHLKSSGLKVLHTREPGGTLLAESIRQVLLDPKNKVLPLSELLLYEAARAQHTQEKILPALSAGKIVLCERYTMSTLAYQGYGRGIDLETINRLNHIATSGLQPDITFVFDIPDSRFKERSAEFKPDRLEREPRQFRLRVRNGYRRLAKTTRRAALIDADKSVPEVQRLLRKSLKKAGLRGKL